MLILRRNKLNILGKITDSEDAAVSGITGEKNRDAETLRDVPVKRE